MKSVGYCSKLEQDTVEGSKSEATGLVPVEEFHKMELTPFNTLAKDHGRYFRRGATFFRVMAAIYLMSIFSVLSGHPISLDLIIPAPLIGVLFYTLARILDFLGDVAVMVDDMWLRVEDTRRGVRRQEERQS